MQRRMPGLVTRYLARAPEGTKVVGIDEDTALIWDDGSWTVHGRQKVWLLRTDGRTPYDVGQQIDLPALD
jgi:hypothetical protein